jgi:hypothetical protein
MKRLILTSLSGFHLLGAGLADLVVHFSYRFAWGQLPSSDELSAFLGRRSKKQRPGYHWSDIARPRRAEDKEGRNRSLVDFCEVFDAIELWFDPHPNDQLQLIWLLDHFRSHPETAAKLVFRLVDFDLLGSREAELRKFEVFDLPVTDAELNTASRSWQAYCSPTPEACFDLLSSNLSALPMLRPALVELLEELPSGVTGLGATEMRLLEMLAWGFANTNPLFHLRTIRGTRIFGEWEVGYLLDGLAFGPKPAVAGLDEELRTLSRENLRDRHPAYLRSRLSLTEFGKAIVAHKEDFSRQNPIDRWWGGTHLTNDNMWRWTPTLVKPSRKLAGRGVP